MPARAARALTESSRPLDRRILTRSVLGLNSKRTGTIPDKSYSERSAVATKCSASSSVLRTGSFFNFFFLLVIVVDLNPDRREVHERVYDCKYKCKSYSARLAPPQLFSDAHRPRS